MRRVKRSSGLLCLLIGGALAYYSAKLPAAANPQQATMGSGPDMPSAAYVFERQSSGAWRAEATDASLTPVESRAGVATYEAALDLDDFLLTQP